jgi:hypothetical protein
MAGEKGKKGSKKGKTGNKKSKDGRSNRIRELEFDSAEGVNPIFETDERVSVAQGCALLMPPSV